VCLSGLLWLGQPVATYGFTVERLTQAGNPTGESEVDSSLHLPVDIDIAPGNTGYYFVSQLGGRSGDATDADAITDSLGKVLLMDRATGIVDYANPFLSISDTSTFEGHPSVPEVGLMSIEFHPDFETNGKFYAAVAVTLDGSTPPLPPGDTRTVFFTTQVREYTADPNNLAAGAAFSKTIIDITQPRFNHNLNWLGFNPLESANGDHRLYIALGDGGDQNDPMDYGQDPTNLYGSVLRIDIDADDYPADPDRNYAIPADNPFVSTSGRDEVYAYGLRNPWRASFDRETGDLYIGDVGQFKWEEVNVLPGNILPADDRNFGWRLREGFATNATAGGSAGGPQPIDGIDPAIAIAHGSGDYKGNSVVGGILYRGPITELYGKYIFADSVSGNIWAIDPADFATFDPNDPDATLISLNDDFAPQDGSYTSIVSFAQDEQGNLLIVDNGYDDAGIGGHIFRLTPDPIPGDLDGDGFVGLSDLDLILQHWNQTVPPADPLADPTGDDFVGLDDLDIVLQNWNAGVPPSTNTNIPEPTTFGLLLMVFAATLSRHKH